MPPFNTTQPEVQPSPQRPTHYCYQGVDGAFYFAPASAPISIPMSRAPAVGVSPDQHAPAVAVSPDQQTGCYIAETVAEADGEKLAKDYQLSPATVQAPVVYTTFSALPPAGYTYAVSPPSQLVTIPTSSTDCTPLMSPAACLPPAQPQQQQHFFAVPAAVGAMTSPMMYSTPPASLYSPAPLSTSASGSSLSSRASSPASALSSGNESISTRLEVLWFGDFQHYFSRYPQHQWSLEPIENPNDADAEGDVHTWQDSAKVRFSCGECGNCWTSMKGRVIFKYKLDTKEKIGKVWFRLTGQQCLKCKNPEFVHAMWYQDEVRKVVHNLHEKVSNTFYGNATPRLRIDRRRGQPKAPHPLASCQACSFGICREEHNFR